MELVGIGNALMDVIAFVDEDLAPSLGFHNNSVVHLDRRELGRVLDLLGETVVSAGGGAANAMRTAALLGLRTAFVGCVGEDDLGIRYRDDMALSGVDCRLCRSTRPTGVYCALIRPDGGRTLLVAPGAALDLSRAEIPASIFRPGAFLYLEGFLAHRRELLEDCAVRAEAAGMTVALDLGSQTLVRAKRDFLLDFISRSVDLLFANEDEFAALVDLPLREGLGLLDDELEIVIKRAERGALWASGGAVVESPVRELWPVDETGAGDAFAAGFLAGRTQGLPPERCLRLGNRIAEEVLAVPALGVDPKRLGRAASLVTE
ncbi:MAG TPA: adenosine kinase [Rectinemataceae bacterium]|nr:adenosine kinase [Rectinemataceae bacterium]